jgi:catechol 2,3-dioxygenase-like lactoylglutathione lyase family enzyme
MLLNLSQIGQIALPVSDVDRAEAFYETVLGLRKLYRFGSLTFFDCAGVRLLLEKSNDMTGTKRGCIYFRCADIDHDLWMAFFTDPDGHTLALMQEAPKGYAPPKGAD